MAATHPVATKSAQLISYLTSPEGITTNTSLFNYHKLTLAECEKRNWRLPYVMKVVGEQLIKLGKAQQGYDRWEKGYLSTFYAFSFLATQKVRDILFAHYTPAIRRTCNVLQSLTFTMATDDESSVNHMFYINNTSLVDEVSTFYQAPHES